MKLSYSIKGWRGLTWTDFCGMSKEYGFSGIELRNIREEDMPSAPEVIRQLINLRLAIPCIDCICDLAEVGKIQENQAEIIRCVVLAEKFHVPYIRLHASAYNGNYQETVNTCLNAVIPFAGKKGVTLLMETFGAYADTGRLRDLLNEYACDELAALWDMQHPYRLYNEQPETTITNLGAYIKHVHIKDSEVTDNGLEYRLVGEGSLPIPRMLDALRSVNYDGFISLEWDPDWFPELGSADIIFPHFVSYMNRFDDLSKAKSTLYTNRAGTGKYVWKKESIIDYTFPQVLDRMVREFPDQYAVKYTTLNYTRTYSEFRDDVDEFARALISLGVKPGDKVSIWATNVPQWFITFWAAVKIGAVLVTVNTSYKIHESEYLFRQSDTHTLVMISGYSDSNYSEIIGELCPELKSLKPGKPLSSAAMLDLLRRMNTAVSVHGFRSTFRDWAAEKTNAPREVAEMALAHQTGSRVERAYMRSDLFERRRHLMDEWAAWCEKKPNVIDCLGQTSSVDPRQCLDIPVFLYQQQAVTHPEKSAVTGEDQHLGRNTLCTATSQSAEKNQ